MLETLLNVCSASVDKTVFAQGEMSCPHLLDASCLGGARSPRALLGTVDALGPQATRSLFQQILQHVEHDNAVGIGQTLAPAHSLM